MAAYLDEEGIIGNDTNSSELIQWLRDNNLQHIIPIFNKENMTMDELIEYSKDENEFKNYLKSLQIPQPSIHRICFKLKTKLNNNNNNKSKSKIIRIIISDEEDKC
eukprot:301377_1